MGLDEEGRELLVRYAENRADLHRSGQELERWPQKRAKQL